MLGCWLVVDLIGEDAVTEIKDVREVLEVLGLLLR
jgi:hypothetical protein